jgi:hypothetical protein
MVARRHLVLIVAGVLASLGASYPTQNFVVEAPNMTVAQQVGQAAEVYRRQKAMEWLGHEMPPWPQRCPIQVKVTMNGPTGATQFAFDGGQVRQQIMHIEGPLDRLLNSVLPHEVTHTVFAYYFRSPVPRWADEGGSVLSEDDLERDRHDKLVRHILNSPGRMIPLRRLFSLREYPGDVMALYAEGFSVSNYLVNQGGRENFLRFVAHGMSPYGWDSAVRTFYHYNRVEELENAWLAHMHATRGQTILAQNTNPGRTADPAHRIMVRQTVPPTQPEPVFRAQAGSEFEGNSRTVAAVRPGYLPDAIPTAGPSLRGMTTTPAVRAAHDPWVPAGTASQPVTAVPSAPPPSVLLGTPQSLSSAPAGVPASPASPVGYPR